MALDRLLQRHCNEKSWLASGVPPASDRFAELAPKRKTVANQMKQPSLSEDTGPQRQSVSDRMRQKNNPEEKAAPKQSVAELMRQSSEASPCSDDKHGSGGRARDEVFSEIRALLETNSTLQQADFDYHIRQHLHALLGSGGRQQLHDALKMINVATSKKQRAAVKNWPAYLRKLLTKFSEDAKARARAEKGIDDFAANVPTEKVIEAGSGKEEKEEETWLKVLDKEMPEDDQWPQGSSADAKQNRSKPPPPAEAPPPPPMEAPPPPPHTIAASPSCPPMMQAAPQTSLKSTLASVEPPTPPPALPPSMFGQNRNHDSQQKRRQQPPTPPPAASPEFYLNGPLPELANPAPQGYPGHHDVQTDPSPLATQKQESTTSLNFPLEAWAAWLHDPRQHVAAN